MTQGVSVVQVQQGPGRPGPALLKPLAHGGPFPPSVSTTS